MEAPCFDEVVRAYIGDLDAPTSESFSLVIHRNADGAIGYAHTPMDASKVMVCEICYSGVRVWLNPA